LTEFTLSWSLSLSKCCRSAQSGSHSEAEAVNFSANFFFVFDLLESSVKGGPAHAQLIGLS